MKTKENARL